MMRFKPPYRVEGHGEEEYDDIDALMDAEYTIGWGRGYYVLDTTGLVMCDVPFRKARGLGFALLLQDEAKILAEKISRLLNADADASATTK